MDTYHHGDLKAAVLKRAVEVIAEAGPQALSLRKLAVDLGVSHTAPRHHFGDLTGVITAVAAEGFELLAERLDQAQAHGGSYLDAGVAYVAFATEHPAHFRVMFAPTLLNGDDPRLVQAKQAAFAELTRGVRAMAEHGQVEDAAAAVIAGWSVVHGLATLELTGNLSQAGLRELVADGDILDIARRTTGMLYGSPGPAESAVSGATEADPQAPEGSA